MDDVKDMAKVGAGVEAKKILVIGENMDRRVIPYAEKIGAEYYSGMPNFKKGMESKGLLHNEAAIKQKMSEGYEILDIGPDFAKRSKTGTSSANYEMERRVTKNYSGYNKNFTRTGKGSLVVIE